METQPTIDTREFLIRNLAYKFALNCGRTVIPPEDIYSPCGMDYIKMARIAVDELQPEGERVSK